MFKLTLLIHQRKKKVESKWNLGYDYGRWDEENMRARTQNYYFNSRVLHLREEKCCHLLLDCAEYK